MKRMLAALLAAALLAPASASAGLTLTKARAWRVARSAAREVYLQTDDTTSYDVEAPEDCARRSPRTVDCQAQVSTGDDADGVTCDFTVRVRLSKAGQSSWDILGEPNCG